MPRDVLDSLLGPEEFVNFHIRSLYHRTLPTITQPTESNTG